jgi:hypothetical protein
MHCEVATHCSLGFVQIDTGKEHEHHEIGSIVLDFNAIFFERESFKFFVRRDDRSFGNDREIECFELLEIKCRRPNPVWNIVRNNFVTMLYGNSLIG